MKKILNVGCGNDTYGTHFVDLYPSRPEVKKCNLDWQKLPFKSNYFDVVYCKNVLEHLTNPGFALKEMHRVLKKGGKLILITDNSSYFGWLLKDHAKKYEKIKLGGKDRHYSLFTPGHLENFAKTYNFKRIKVKYIRGNFGKNIYGAFKKAISILLSLTPLAYSQILLEAVK